MKSRQHKLTATQTKSAVADWEGEMEGRSWGEGDHSLPGAEEFYRQAGLIDCGADPDKEDLVYFECAAQETDKDW